MNSNLFKIIYKLVCIYLLLFAISGFLIYVLMLITEHISIVPVIFGCAFYITYHILIRCFPEAKRLIAISLIIFYVITLITPFITTIMPLVK